MIPHTFVGTTECTFIAPDRERCGKPFHHSLHSELEAITHPAAQVSYSRPSVFGYDSPFIPVWLWHVLFDGTRLCNCAHSREMKARKQ